MDAFPMTFLGDIIHLYLYLKTVLSFSLPERLYFCLLVLHKVAFMLQAGFSGRFLLFFYQIYHGSILFSSHLFAPSCLARLWGTRQVPNPVVLLELLAGCFFAEQLIALEVESFGVTVCLCLDYFSLSGFMVHCCIVVWIKIAIICPFGF